MAQRPLLLLTPFALVAVAAGWLSFPSTQDGALPLLTEAIHLGDDQTPEWPEASPAPMSLQTFGMAFELTAEQHAALLQDSPAALRVWCRHVDGNWELALNGKTFASLPRGAERKEHLLALPAELLKVGSNAFSIQGKSAGDDITIGPVDLLAKSFRDTLQLLPLAFQVTDKDGKGLPARLTVANGQGLVPLYDPSGKRLAIRTGVAYTDANGRADFEVSAGQILTVYATHGPEWNVEALSVALPQQRKPGSGPPPPFQDEDRLGLSLHKQVPTPAWLAVDTHMHTLTFSGHGDASVEERQRTLAGEGLDVAIATDHNHQTDYRLWQEQEGFQDDFRSIIGNEVTTDIGHFNAFPFAPGAAIPDASLTDWQALIDEIHAKGAQTIILNHPRWPDRERGPYGVSGLDPRSGRFADGLQLPVDAMEVFNSTTPEVPWQELRTDWFSLLNAGSRLRGVGSSDSHTVYDPVGQGRTWIHVSSDDPHQVSDEEIATAIREGRSSMGLGLFGTVTVSGAEPGDLLAVPATQEVQVELHMPLPDWAKVTLVEVFVDGLAVATMEVGPEQGKGGSEQRFSFTIPVPSHDSWLVVCATGPKPQEPWWTGKFADLAWMSNPIWLDADHDGAYRTPQETAQQMLQGIELDSKGLPQAAALAKMLRTVDLGVAVQLLLAAEDHWGATAPKRVGMIPGLAPSAYRPTLSALLDQAE